MFEEWFETIRVAPKYYDVGILTYRDGVPTEKGGSTSAVYLREDGSYLVKTLLVSEVLDGEVNLFYAACNSLDEVFCALINHSGWDETYKAQAHLKQLKQAQDPTWKPTPENLSLLRQSATEFVKRLQLH